MDLHLISATVCPFVQRAVILLREKDASFRVTYIDLRDKPDWFLAISPRGKVPVLVADGTPLFESQAICEFLEEATPEPALLPSDLVGRARDRAWFGMTSEDLFMPMYRMMVAKDEDGFNAVVASLLPSLARLEEALQGRAYLSGDGSRFGMADAAAAPFFSRVSLLKSMNCWALPPEFPAVAAWGARLLAQESVQASLPASFASDSRQMMTGTYALSCAA